MLEINDFVLPLPPFIVCLYTKIVGDRICPLRSGYGIAAQALTAVIRAHDGRGPQTMLTNNILNVLGLSTPDEIIGYSFFLLKFLSMYYMK